MSKTEKNPESLETQKYPDVFINKPTRRELLALVAGAVIGATTRESISHNDPSVPVPADVLPETVDKNDAEELELSNEKILNGLDYISGLLGRINPVSTGMESTNMMTAYDFMAYGVDDAGDRSVDSVMDMLNALEVDVAGEQLTDGSWYLNLRKIGSKIGDQEQPSPVLDCYVIGHPGGVVGLDVQINGMPTASMEQSQDIYTMGRDDTVLTSVSIGSDDIREGVTIINGADNRETRVSAVVHELKGTTDYEIMVFASGENPLGNPGGLMAEEVLPGGESMINNPHLIEPAPRNGNGRPQFDAEDIKQA